MHTKDLHQLIAEMAEERKLHQENYRALQQSLFKFKTGLQMVKSELGATTSRFFELSGPIFDVYIEPMVVEPMRKAS